MLRTIWLSTFLLFFAALSNSWADNAAPAAPGNLRLVSNGDNRVPVALDDSYQTVINTVLTVPAPGVLANDSDPDGDALTAVLVSGTTSGTLELNPDGSFNYQPQHGFSGQDTFNYRANDGRASSNPATVTISVSSLEEGLIAHWSFDDGSGTVAADSSKNANNLVLRPAGTEPVWGLGYRGGALVFDGARQYAETSNLPVDQSVGAKNTISFWMNWGGAQTNMSVLTSVNGPELRVSGGRFGISTAKEWPGVDTLGISWPTNTYSKRWVHVVAVFYNPDSNTEGWENLWASESRLYINGVAQDITQVGTLQSRYTTMQSTIRLARSNASRYYDGRIDDLRIYSRELTAKEVSQLYNPWAFDDFYLRNASLPLRVEAPGVLTNDAAVEGAVLAAALVDQPKHGTVRLSADGSFLYTPNQSYFWGDSFRYKVNDGLFDSSVATVQIQTDAPVAADIDSYNTHRNTPVTYGTAGGVLHYATVKKGSATATAFPLTTNPAATAEVISGPANGALLFNSDGSFTYTPEADFVGTDSFVYRAYDGESYYSQAATATIIVGEKPKPISQLALWESRMLQYGKIHGDRFISGSYNGWHTYYDAQRIFYSIADYADDTYWLTAAEVAGDAYLRDYVWAGTPGSTQGYWKFTHGLAEDYLRHADSESRDAVVALSQSGHASDAMNSGISYIRSREIAYALTSHINAQRVGHARIGKRTAQLFEDALSHLDQWMAAKDTPEVATLTPEGYQYLWCPFMIGLTAEALIFYWDYVSQDARIPQKLQDIADAIWVIAWQELHQAFTYRIGESPPGSGAPDLNLLIAPLYSWLYLQTGDATYRDRGDAVFAGGVERAWLENYKPFNQGFRWSFDYLKWRRDAEERLFTAAGRRAN